MQIYRAPAEYVDGILELHNKLDKVCRLAYDVSRRYFMNQNSIGMKYEDLEYHLFVDFAESQPTNALKGYFVFNNTIHHFFSANLDYALFFPVRDHSGGDDAFNRKGITIAKIRELLRSREKVIITLTRKRDSRISQPLYIAYLQNENEPFNLDVIDDIGAPYCTFTDIGCLRRIKLPKALESTSFSLVGKHYYAPLSTSKESFCVLFAQIDNEYDSNAVKVLRWFPEKRTDAEKKHNIKTQAKEQLNQAKEQFNILFNKECQRKIQELERVAYRPVGVNGHYFFELGYISRNENAGLHKFMVDNDSRLLFGTLKSGQISLLGGIDIFFSNDFYYPFSISKIQIK